jgi:protein-L-isoaspartate(D-aspartate) O-methyltransferase
METIDFGKNHQRMLNEQIIKRGITDKKLIGAFESVPRHLFLQDDYKHLAYEDCPLPIGFGQTISQPYIVAFMISELHLTGSEHVLEVGTGCGYQAAILSHLVGDVITIEIIPELVQLSTRIINGLKLPNISIVTGDGSMGWTRAAPFDVIIVSAAAPVVPKNLLEQLAEGGRLIIPIGNIGVQHLEIWSYSKSDYHKLISIPVTFVPLRGKHGWQE